MKRTALALKRSERALSQSMDAMAKSERALKRINMIMVFIIAVGLATMAGIIFLKRKPVHKP